MERLTFVDEDGMVLFDNPAGFPEDVGFTIRELAESEEWETLDNIAQRLANCEQRLKYYKDLEEQNKLMELPCAVGDAVYEICDGFIEPCTVEVIYLADYKDEAGNSSYMIEIHYNREDCPWVSTEVYFTDIGKTVFLTKEEAEAALKELERSKGE